MSTEVEDPSEQTVASLVSGILGDLQLLVEQQLQLTRREIEEEIHQGVASSTVLAIGMAVFFLDAIELSLTLVHLLHWFSSPLGSDPAWFPLWACHGLVMTLLTAISAVLLFVGRAKLISVKRWHNPTAAICQEHVQ